MDFSICIVTNKIIKNIDNNARCHSIKIINDLNHNK